MKKLLFIFCLITIWMACNDDSKNDIPKSPIQGLELPTEQNLKAGEEITIKGKGFTTSDEIWLKATETKTIKENSYKAVITKVTENSINFTIPSDISGSFEVILKQNGQEYKLGKLEIQENKVVKYYVFCYDEDKNELAEVDIETGKLTWNGLKIPRYGSNSKGYVFNDQTDEFITFGDNRDEWIINKLNMKTKAVTTLKLSNLNGADDFDEIIKSNDNKFYIFCYDDDKNELAEVDIETGKLTWNGLKIPRYGSNSRGYVFNDQTDEFITFGDNRDEWIINKLNMKTKAVTTLKLSNLSGADNFDEIIKSNDNKFYIFCYDDNKNELAEVDIETGKLTWNGLKIPEYGSNSRGYLFNEQANEFITFGDNGDWVINKLNMKTKSVVTLYLQNQNGAGDFDNIIAY